MTLTEVVVSADMGGFGTEARWAEDPERSLVMLPPVELGLSEPLASDFRSWQRWFDDVVNAIGLEGRFDILGDGFDEAGSRLAERVAAELGRSCRVVYVPQGGWCRSPGRGRQLVVQG
jgi:hypothetical protein